MTAREFLIVFGLRIKETGQGRGDDVRAAEFKRKHGVDVREGLAKMKRLEALSAAQQGNDAEVRELAGTFAAISYRKAG